MSEDRKIGSSMLGCTNKAWRTVACSDAAVSYGIKFAAMPIGSCTVINLNFVGAEPRLTRYLVDPVTCCESSSLHPRALTW